ncbi:CRACD-like protein isoform X2 [Pseudorasbora parva]|uniref:CRACD-like protein isoform X2 n=1 Tax=Pseudorasbora parva TaxID=51549 RepID=UPI00351EF143
MNVLEASGDPEGEGSDDFTGRKKSRLKSFKSRLFGKIKRKEDDGGMKQSQSESDIAWGMDDSDYSMLGSRAFSHDSIFQAEHSHSDTEPLRILSQENIHGKIRALQIKLQQQKMHLGPPPVLLPIKRCEDLGGSSEDDGFPRSPPEVSRGEGLYMSISNKASSQPLSPRPISPAPVPLSPLAPVSGVDFSTPPRFTSLLDNSAARHRMSLKPKNQRASAKNKRAGSRARSESLNNLDCPLTIRVEEEVQALVKEIPRARSYSSQVLRPGERLTASQIKSFPVSPLMSLQTAGDSRQVSAEPELERKVLSTSPPSPNLREMPPAESPVAKPPIPVDPIDRKGKGEVGEKLNSFKLLKNSQNNLVSTERPNVSTTPELTLVKDEKFNAMQIQNRTDALSKYNVQNAVNIEECMPSTHAPASVICGVNLRPSSLRRNAPSTEEKQESKTLQPVSTVSAVNQEDHPQRESIKPQKTLSGSFHFSVSSDKNQERQRTASFTGVVRQAGLNEEAAEATPSLNFKKERQVSSQVEKTIKDPCANLPPASKKEDKTDTDPVMPTKEESQDKKVQEIGVEATEEEVQELAKEAFEDVMEDMTGGKGRETTNAFGVRLRSTSLSLKFRLDKAQSEDKAKRHNVEVRSPTQPLASQSDSASYVEPEDQHNGPGSIRLHAKLKNPSLQADESSTSVQFSSSPPKGFCRDKERAGFLRHAEPPQPTSPASKDTKIVTSPPKEGTDLPREETTAVSSQENAPTSTATEVSWMEMAREKTRSLQQLFTSRLPEFTSLQSRPTTLTTTQPQMQTSTSQANPKIIQNITSQPTATQPPLRTTETKQGPSAQPTGRSTQYTTQLTPMQPQTRATTSQNSNQTTTNQSQIESTREIQFQSKTNSTTKPTLSTVTSCTSNVQSTTQAVLTACAQACAPQSSPLRAASQTPTQAILRPTPPPVYPHLSSSPKLTSHLVSQQSANTVSKDQTQNEAGEPTVISGKADRASVPQGKGTGLEDGRPVWAAGLGNKTSLVQRWETQTTTATKTGEQKATSESQSTSQSTVPLRPISKVSEASVSSVPMRSTDREDKWQQTPVPPSSSPSSSSPLQSVRDSAQPSWMELAKRKSMAWNDKTMD